MAAYSLSDRFSPDSKYYRFYDPGAYQYDESYKVNPSRAPFLSKTPRKTIVSLPIFTHAIYKPDIPSKIPNCSSMMSKIPRFPYEALSKEDLEEILCKCGIPTTCQCPTEEIKQEPEIVCQAKVPKLIIKGVTPRTMGDSGLSAPSKGDCGFEVYRDGSQKRLKQKVGNESPPFYDARVIESTMFYQGWKWSKWSSSRSTKPLDQSPGPADYTLEKKPNEIEKCAEKVRARKRKESKQYRFIEMVQRRNILENAPGPASYSPVLPKGTDLRELGPKSDRFTSLKYEIHPGPADHNIKRDFEQPESPIILCHAVLPEPPCFGVKAERFKARKEDGPSPATYCAAYKPCQFQTCSKAPFGSTNERFQMTPLEDADENNDPCENHVDKDPCPHHTWEFKSKKLRFKPLQKCWNEPSPADFLPTAPEPKKPLNIQRLAPFCSSNGRLQPWYNYISVFGTLVTPGPGYYNLEKPNCYPAVTRGPLYRDRRFRSPSCETPSPNAYNVGGGIESVLDTYNERLKNNIEKHHNFRRDMPSERKILTVDEKESLLINKCIALCDETPPPSELFSAHQQDKKDITKGITETKKSKKKLLRFFLYKRQIPLWN